MTFRDEASTGIHHPLSSVRVVSSVDELPCLACQRSQRHTQQVVYTHVKTTIAHYQQISNFLPGDQNCESCQALLLFSTWWLHNLSETCIAITCSDYVTPIGSAAKLLMILNLAEPGNKYLLGLDSHNTGPAKHLQKPLGSSIMTNTFSAEASAL